MSECGVVSVNRSINQSINRSIVAFALHLSNKNKDAGFSPNSYRSQLIFVIIYFIHRLKWFLFFFCFTINSFVLIIFFSLLCSLITNNIVFPYLIINYGFSFNLGTITTFFESDY